MVMLQKGTRNGQKTYTSLTNRRKSLGNEYISEVIVPLLKERARAGKRVFISTHDANIAVRTLPYCSIYRCYGQDGYSTYMGNPFTNNLVNIAKPDDLRDWKAVSMRTLEGGEEAFGERGSMETLEAMVENAGDKYSLRIKVESGDVVIPLSDDNANAVKSAFNKLIQRIREGEFKIQLDKEGDDLFSMVAKEYLTQLNKEIARCTVK